jgi:hypothetical protein
MNKKFILPLKPKTRQIEKCRIGLNIALKNIYLHKANAVSMLN